MGDLEVPTNNNHTDANKPVPPDAPTNGDTALPHVEFTVLHNRAKHHFSLPPHTTVLELKQALEPLTKVPVSMQKLIHRGLLEDSTQIQSLNLTSREAKLMLVGASQLEADRLRQAEEAASSAVGDVAEQNNQTGDGELSWCEQTEHKRVLERFGKPENAMVGILNSEEMLAPNECLTGLCDKRGQPLRLRIRPDTCELWLATNDVTHKFPLSTIHDVVSQPIKDHPEYHIMAFQLGPTPKSRYFVYWLPSQYVDSIITMVLQHKVLRFTDRTQL
ncbi:Ubiquitin domain-containing protein ubfd1 [Clonorchis sinensis]|uniref:Ubiquitin domain-containing protein ubfd1 n=1 Tax=Clonorchis sinensis TaxID=79923 RepID=A0A419PR72_CLOSI|nr:Ubiquitin domain-containing protein ubfd1 [Clonorchis sinensis]